MNRRHFLLATVGIAGLAGCNSPAGDESTPTLTDTSTRTQTATKTPTKTATEVPTETETQTNTLTEARTDTPTGTRTTTETEAPTETRTTTETEAPTETQTAEPTPDHVDEEIATALNYIEDSIDQYAANIALDGVLITNRFPVDDLREGLFEARRALGDAESDSPSTAQRKRIKRGWDAFWFAWWVGQTHNAINAAYQSRPSYTGTGTKKFKDRIESAETELAQLREEAAARGFEVLSEYSPSEYEQCLSRFAEILDNCRDLIGVAKAVQQAESKHETAMNEYDVGNYDVAERKLEDAWVAYEDAIESVSEYDAVEAFESSRDTMKCYCSAMSTRCEEYKKAARHGQKGERTRRITTEETATDPDEECDL